MSTLDQTNAWLEEFNSDERNSNLFVPSYYYNVSQFNDLVHTFASSKLSILNTNARSLPKHKSDYDVFLNQITNFQFDILTFEETWLDDSLCDLIQFQNYTLVTKHKLGKKEGGGIAIFISNDLEYSTLDITVPIEMQPFFDCLFIETKYGNKSIVIGVLYRSPTFNSIKDFYKFIDPILQSFETSSKEVLLMGDTNIDILKYQQNNLTSSYLDRLISHGFLPKISLPTRVTHTSATLIDHIFHKLSDTKTYQGSITTDITDHYINFICLELNKSNQNSKKEVTYRVVNDETINSFNNDLRTTSWNRILNNNDVDEAYNDFINIYNNLMDKNLPVKTIKFNRKIHKIKPWITKGILISMRQRYKLAMKLKGLHNEDYRLIQLDRYKKYRNCLNSVIRLSKQLHWSNLFKKYEKDMKNTWKLINNILHKENNKNNISTHFITDDNNELKDNQEIADSFNEFFVNIGPKLSNNIKTSPKTPKSYMRPLDMTNSFFLIPTTMEEVDKAIKRLRPKTSCGFDEISPKLLKATHIEILKPLTHICNLSLTTGTFPEKMKTAKVIPIFKSGNKHSFSNYRPVSLLPSFSKVLERLVYNRLQSYFNMHNLLTPCQFGFRENMSTELAILKMQNLISNVLNEKQNAFALFLDLSKAFDTLNHSTLLDKLQHYGIRGTAYNWFSSYLSNRTQFTFYNCHQSATSNISTGVPQGSILGPLLFIIYVNDITNATTDTNFILFADDTNIIFNYGKQMTKTKNQNINKKLEELSNWFSANKLSINTSKTKYMIFHTPRNINSVADYNFYLNGSKIECTNQIKFLGVILTDTLSWKEHINDKSNKISKTVGIMSRLKYELPSKTLLSIYNSLIAPHLNYSVVAWGDSPDTHLKRMRILQKRALRIIDKKPYNSHTNPLFYKYSILKLNDLYTFRCSLLYHKSLRNGLPTYFSSLLKTNENTHEHFTRGRNNIHVNLVQSELGKQNFNYKIAFVWNKLDDTIKKERLDTVSSFTKKLKRYLIVEYSKPCQIQNCTNCYRN